MTAQYFTTPAGEEMAVLPRAELEALMQGADHSRAVAAYRAGHLPGLTADQTRALVAARSPLAFWRGYRGMTQTALASMSGIAQNYLSDLENGKRAGSVDLWLKLGRALDVPVEALVEAD